MLKEFALSLLTISFLPGLSHAADPKTAADEFCSCAKPLIEKTKSIQKSMQAGNMAALQGMMAEIQAHRQKMTACMGELNEKYAHVKEDKEFTEAVQTEMEKNCPFPKFDAPAS